MIAGLKVWSSAHPLQKSCYEGQGNVLLFLERVEIAAGISHIRISVDETREPLRLHSNMQRTLHWPVLPVHTIMSSSCTILGAQHWNQDSGEMNIQASRALLNGCKCWGHQRQEPDEGKHLKFTLSLWNHTRFIPSLCHQMLNNINWSLSMHRIRTTLQKHVWARHPSGVR